VTAQLRIEPVREGEDGGTGDRWYAVLDLNGSPSHDGSGPTIELALARLILQIGDELAR
jgi:hypothetical protein